MITKEQRAELHRMKDRLEQMAYDMQSHQSRFVFKRLARLIGKWLNTPVMQIMDK